MLERARCNSGALDERVDLRELEPDDPSQLVSGQCPFIDASLAFLGEREVANAAAAASNDAAGAALRDSDFYRQGRVVIDPALAEAVARRSVDARGERYLHDIRVDVETDGDRVRVIVSGRVDYLFAGAIPGAPRHADVQAAATATAERDG